MTGARVRLILTSVAFVAWLCWLGVAVAQKGRVQIISRAQLTAATLLVVAEIQLADDGTPRPQVAVVETLEGQAPATLEVVNLPAAATPLPGANGSRTPTAGRYFLPLVKTESGYRLAGLPRSPGGYEAVTPDRPLVYPWQANVQEQLRGLGIVKP
jgi:hypothetical protein